MQLTVVTQLTKLVVTGCDLNDAGVRSICSSLPALRRLGLSANHRITDASLAGVAALQQLTWLYVGGTVVTDVGVEQLQAAWPQLHVVSLW